MNEGLDEDVRILLELHIALLRFHYIQEFRFPPDKEDGASQQFASSLLRAVAPENCEGGLSKDD